MNLLTNLLWTLGTGSQTHSAVLSLQNTFTGINSWWLRGSNVNQNSVSDKYSHFKIILPPGFVLCLFSQVSLYSCYRSPSSQQIFPFLFLPSFPAKWSLDDLSRKAAARHFGLWCNCPVSFSHSYRSLNSLTSSLSCWSTINVQCLSSCSSWTQQNYILNLHLQSLSWRSC